MKAVYCFSQNTAGVRSADIAAFLGVTKPSVHHAMKILQQAGLVIKPLYGEISLTDKGRSQAQIMICRCELLTRLLLSLQVSKKTSELDAWRMEHVISNKTMLHLLQYFKKGKTPENNRMLIDCKGGRDSNQCALAERGKCTAC